MASTSAPNGIALFRESPCALLLILAGVERGDGGKAALHDTCYCCVEREHFGLAHNFLDGGED